MRPALALVAVALLLAVASPATAQSLGTTTRIDVSAMYPPPGPTGSATTTATVEYCYATPGGATPSPTSVTVDVEDSARGVAVTVSPSSLTFEPRVVLGSGTSCAPTQEVSITASVYSSGWPTTLARIVVTAAENPPLAASSSEAALFAEHRADSSPPPHLREDRARTPHAETAASSDEMTPADDAPAALGPFALAGGVAGLAVALRRRRARR